MRSGVKAIAEVICRLPERTIIVQDFATMLAVPSRLAPCPKTPNCVSTEAPPGRHRMEPIPYNDTPVRTRERLLEILRNYPRTRIVRQEPDYIKAECRSRIFHFVDDVELVFDDAVRQIHFRSASRVGYGDRGVNRRRMKEIRAVFLGAGS